MAVSFTVKTQWTDTMKLHLIGNFAFSGNYTTGGDTINFGALSTDTQPVIVKSGSPPFWVDIAGQTTLLYNFVYGLTINNSKIKIISGGAELAAGAYPGGVTGDTITYHAVFNKFQ